MREVIYPYDRGLYNRSFLNCYQRQSMVMLAERVPEVHQLFYPCLISTDDMVEQIIRLQRPRYDFESRFFEPADLARIGVVSQDVPVDSYAEARPLLLETVAEQGYALLVVDVFYLPHCPEYRVKHVVHAITLREFDAGAREWSIIDDNRASVLCTYRYPEEVVAASYDNNERRRVRYFCSTGFDPDEVAGGTGRAFSELLRGYRDTRRLLSSVDDVIGCPWVAPGRMISLLHDAFSIYQGSRLCLREYASRAVGDGCVDAVLGRIVERAVAVQKQLLVGTVTGSVDPSWMRSACLQLASDEDELLHRLRAADSER